MWNYLGDEFTGILTKLPVKSIIRFMCVSKSWHSLISSSHLISSQLRETLASKNNSAQIFVHDRSDFRESRLLPFDDARQDNHFRSMISGLRFDFPCMLRIVGSINGLICFAATQRGSPRLFKFIIVNPQIGSFLLIEPPMPYVFSFYTIKGFGFDDTNLDYKILLAKSNRYVFLYSLNSGSWRLISCQESWYTYDSDPTTIFMKDCFHWVAYVKNMVGNPPFIMVFDLKSKNFRRILFQERLSGRVTIIPGFDGSSIGVIEQICSDLIHVWSLEQSGSWSKLAEKLWIGKRSRTCIDAQGVIGFKNKDELFVRYYGGRIASLNIKSKEVRNVIRHEERDYQFTVHTRLPSLVLLDKKTA